jgi:hypothetical protein
LLQNNVIDKITLADNVARSVVTSQAELRRIGADNYAVITAMFTKPPLGIGPRSLGPAASSTRRQEHANLPHRRTQTGTITVAMSRDTTPGQQPLAVNISKRRSPRGHEEEQPQLTRVCRAHLIRKLEPWSLRHMY